MYCINGIRVELWEVFVSENRRLARHCLYDETRAQREHAMFKMANLFYSANVSLQRSPVRVQTSLSHWKIHEQCAVRGSYLRL